MPAGGAALTDQQRREALEQARQAVAQARPGAFPAEIAAQTIVTSSMQRAGAQTQVALRIVVPVGDSRQTVRVVSVGPNGSAKEVYQGVHAPGEMVSASVTGTPPFVVQVYVGGVLVKQITAPAP